MLLIIWILVFLASLYVLIKGADWLLYNGERIGLAAGLSPFLVGVTIVAFGTALPELISSIIASYKGLSDFPVATAVGSNITNILLIIGIAAIISRKITLTKNIIDLDLPLLAISTALLLGVLWDRQVTTVESIFLIVAYGIYFCYIVFHKQEKGFGDMHSEFVEVAAAGDNKFNIVTKKEKKDREKHKISKKNITFLVLGVIFLAIGAKYVVDSVQNISLLLDVSSGLIAISVVALATSLPELTVSIKAVLKKKTEIAIGNVFGENIIMGLLVVGIPGLFGNLTVDEQTFRIGLPTLVIVSLLFVVTGISRRIYIWEGAMFLVIYLLFITKILGIL